MSEDEKPHAPKKARFDIRPLEESHPHLKEFLAYLPQANKESDRGLVLISVAFLDELLRRILVAYFVDPKMFEELVDINGPLGTFSSRIKMCQALALLSELEAKELYRMRRIRNRFSHEVHVSFADQQIKDLCANLTYKAPDYDDVVVQPRGQFDTATSALILHLTNRPVYVGRKRCIPQDWPY